MKEYDKGIDATKRYRERLKENMVCLQSLEKVTLRERDMHTR